MPGPALTGLPRRCSHGPEREESPMKMKLFAAVAAVLSVAFVPLAHAQTFPDRSMTMIIPFAAGGPTDVLGRLVAGRMSEILKQTVVVENINGAGGQTGSLRVANATPDGYEFVLATVGTHAQGQTLYQHPLYNAVTDFTPVILIANIPLVLVARKDLPVNNFKEFVSYLKENQSKMQFGSAGTGSATHLGCLLMNYLLKVNVTHVPYRGSGPAMQDLQGGRIDYLCDVMTTAKPPIDSGAVKGLAVLNATRSDALPNVPTAVEQGVPDLIAYTWNAIFLPKNAPEAVVKKLHDATLEAMHTPAVHDRLTGLGAEIATDQQATPQYLGDLVKSEIAKWAVPIKASGISVE
jgi:tripartite-type tricarboxylate transporter receptor subunit TctC